MLTRITRPSSGGLLTLGLNRMQRHPLFWHGRHTRPGRPARLGRLGVRKTTSWTAVAAAAGLSPLGRRLIMVALTGVLPQ